MEYKECFEIMGTDQKRKNSASYSPFFLSCTSVSAIYGILSHSYVGTTDIYYDKRKLPILQADPYKNFIKSTI